MPPLYPPVAAFMSIELSFMAALIATVVWRRPRVNPWLVLIPVLLLGRVLYLAMAYGFARIIGLPAGFLAGLSFASGWPGLILMVVVVPPVARLGRRHAGAASVTAGESE
jgi:riboflavin transporter FmnP